MAKLTSKNQITTSKKIMDQIPEARYFEVELRDGKATVARIWQKTESLL